RRRMQELSGKFSHDLPLDRRLVQLRDWLRNTYAYSKVVKYPSSGKCALENFLDDPEHNQTGGGICVHFASAAALMAREMGVPYGWIGGRYYEPHGQFVFRGDHAHAWTEIFLSNHGWVIFDVTPSEGLPQSLVSGPGEAPPPLEDFLQVDLDETGQESENPLL